MGKVFEARGWKVTSVDFDPQFKPTLCMNVLDLEPEIIEGNVDLIWASPLCTHYSRARTTARTPRDLEGSDALVRKCLDLTDRSFCHYFIENRESSSKNERCGCGYSLSYCRLLRLRRQKNRTQSAQTHRILDEHELETVATAMQ